MTCNFEVCSKGGHHRRHLEHLYDKTKQQVNVVAEASHVNLLDSLQTYVGDIVSPKKCAACDISLRNRSLLCPTCASTVIRWNGSNDDPLAFAHYGGALATALLRLKYAKRPDLAHPLGCLLIDSTIRDLIKWEIEVVVPVPVPYSRLVDRGYNQAALIARPIARALSARFAPRALHRVDGSPKQASLNRQQRLANLRGAFSVRQPNAVRGRKVLVIDDVSTTGATLSACRAALCAVGAMEVRSAVVARTESPDMSH